MLVGSVKIEGKDNRAGDAAGSDGKLEALPGWPRGLC